MRHKQKHEGYLKNKYFLLIIKKKKLESTQSSS